MSEKKYEFRELQSKDIFPMFKILNKIGVKQFKDCFQSDEIKAIISEKGETGAEAIGVSIALDMAGIILGNIPACEEDIYTMLASVSNLSKKDIEKMGMADFANMIVDFVQKPEFKDFIKVVSGLFK